MRPSVDKRLPTPGLWQLGLASIMLDVPTHSIAEGILMGTLTVHGGHMNVGRIGSLANIKNKEYVKYEAGSSI